MGIKLIRSKKQIEYNDATEKLKLSQIIFSAFSVAWLNPQAIIDGTILFGGMRSTLAANTENLFIIGVCLASAIWFNALALIVFNICEKFKSITKSINLICGIILILYGIKLGYSFVKIVLARAF